MKTSEIKFGALAGMSLEPIKRAVLRWYLRYEIRALDRHMDVVSHQIKNDQRVLQSLTRDRVLLVSRLRGL